jgi:hypothetical protein
LFPNRPSPFVRAGVTAAGMNIGGSNLGA